jgi:hypothetical protein
MSDDTLVLDAESEETSIDTGSDTALETEDSLESSEEESSIDEKEVQRQKTAQGQIDKAKQLLAEGKELPESLKWTQKHIKPETEVPKANLKEELKAELKDDSLFEKLQEELKGLGLSKEEFAKLKSKHILYKSKGFRKGEALQEALEAFAHKRVSAEDRNKKKSASAMPASSSGEDKELSMDNFHNLSKDEKWKVLQKAVA